MFMQLFNTLMENIMYRIWELQMELGEGFQGKVSLVTLIN